MLGVQTAIANKIVAGKGVYILALKANQDDLFQQVMNHVDEHISDDFAGVRSQRPAEDTKNGHTRSNLRTYPQLAVATRMNPAEFNPTDAEKRALMMSIAERGKFGLSPDDCIEVVEYLTHNAKKSGKPMDTRLLDTALNNRKQYDNKESETHWRDMVQSVIDGIIIEPKVKPGLFITVSNERAIAA